MQPIVLKTHRRFSFAEFEAWHLNNGSATLRLLREMDHNVSAARVREELAAVKSRIDVLAEQDLAGAGTAGSAQELKALRARKAALEEQMVRHVAGGTKPGAAHAGVASDTESEEEGEAGQGAGARAASRGMALSAQVLVLQRRLERQRSANESLSEELAQQKISTEALLQTLHEQNVSLADAAVKRQLGDAARAAEAAEEKRKAETDEVAAILRLQLKAATDRVAGLSWRCTSMASKNAKLENRIAHHEKFGGSLAVEGIKQRSAESLPQSKHHAELLGHFEAFDKDGNGSISDDELARVLDYFDFTLTDEVRAKIMAHFDDDDNSTIEFGEFVQLWGYLTCLQKGVCLFDEGEGAEQLSEVETRGRLAQLSKEKAELQRELDLCQSKLLDVAQEELAPAVTERNVNEVTTT